MSSRRRADAVRNDELFLDAGLELLRERGPDRIAALELARSAGLTTGAVYARYENPAEIMVGLWQNRMATPMRMFLENGVDALTADVEVAHLTAAKALSNPNGPLRPGVSVLVAATRVPELAEVVRPDLQSWIDDLRIDAGSDAVHEKQKAFMTAALGCLMFSTVDLFEHDDWVFLRRVARLAHSDQPIGRFPLPAPRPPDEFRVDTGDVARDAIVNGAARVIAHGGIERATTQRIARAAGLQPSELFAQYRTRPELFADVARKILTTVFESSRTITPAVTEDRSSSWQERFLVHKLSEYRSLLQASSRDHRLLRLEFLLAGTHDEVVGLALRQVDITVNRSVLRDIARALTFDETATYRAIRLIRASAFGAMLLQELVGGFDELDLRVLFEPVVQTLEESTKASATGANRVAESA